MPCSTRSARSLVLLAALLPATAAAQDGGVLRPVTPDPSGVLRPDAGTTLPGAILSPRADAGTSVSPLPAPGTGGPDGGMTGAPLPEDAATAEARRLSDLARQAYDLGRFEEALRGYRDAYALKPLPGLLFNIGQCQRQLGDFESAAFSFGRFLDLAPGASNAELARSLLLELEQKKSEADARVRLAASLEEGRLAAARADALQAKLAALEGRRPPELFGKWWFWTAVGTVAVGGVSAWVVMQR